MCTKLSNKIVGVCYIGVVHPAGVVCRVAHCSNLEIGHTSKYGVWWGTLKKKKGYQTKSPLVQSTRELTTQ